MGQSSLILRSVSGTAAPDAAADLLNPFPIYNSNIKGFYLREDAADKGALARNKLLRYDTMAKQNLLPHVPTTFRQGLASEDHDVLRAEQVGVGSGLGRRLRKAHDAAVGLYRRLQNQSREVVFKVENKEPRTVDHVPEDSVAVALNEKVKKHITTAPGPSSTVDPAGTADAAPVYAASYNILVDLQAGRRVTPGRNDVFDECERSPGGVLGCVTNAGKLIRDQVGVALRTNAPPIVLLGEQEHRTNGEAALQAGLGPDWTMLDRHRTCAVWYNNKLLQGTPEAAAAPSKSGLVRGRKDPENVRCLVAGYFPAQELVFGSLWCGHRHAQDPSRCVTAAAQRVADLCAKNSWPGPKPGTPCNGNRVMLAMDSNDYGGQLIGKSFGQDGGLRLEIDSAPPKTCCLGDMRSRPDPIDSVGDFIADTRRDGFATEVIPGAGRMLRSDHLPVRKQVRLPGVRTTGRTIAETL